MKTKLAVGDSLFDLVNTILQVALFFIMAYPLYYIVIASVSEPNEVLTGKVFLFPKGFQMDSYKRVFENQDILRGYANTIFYTITGTLINLAVTLPCGYTLSRRDLRGRSWLMMLFSFTMFFGGGMVPGYMIVKHLKLLNTVWALLLPGAMSVWNMIICRNFFESNIPKELLEVSRIDGCRNFTFFVRIILPLSKALIAVMTLFYAVGHWNSYFSALLYLTDRTKYPLQLLLRNILIASQPLNPGTTLSDQSALFRMIEMLKYALVVVSSLPVLILYPFVQKHFVQGVMIGSIKG
ncbi:MAG: carbohydrate ABC transporter permease [Spirochaetaceae bacterium]|nr:carbohydrate ABC transporter permease [Spirochaetaceae bacterium]